MVKRICVISFGYPTANQPWFAFVDQLVCAFSKIGIECTVIAPQSLMNMVKDKKNLRPTYWEKRVLTRVIRIYQPYYVSMSNLSVGDYYLTDVLFEKAVEKCFKSIKDQKFDLIYGHFLANGLIAARIGEKYRIPSFVACGESIVPWNKLRRNWKYRESLAGIISVSEPLKMELCAHGFCREEAVGVFPNGVDASLFKKMDKAECRKKLGFEKDIFVIAFVGSFIKRKGIDALSEALKQIDNVYSIFIGTGEIVPDCPNQLYANKLPHEQIPVYLNAADAFVLPTLNEGCCNAIVEALSCGLPIVSSDLPFNHGILDESNSILVEPTDINEIKKSIMLLKDNDEYRNKLALGALNKGKQLSIDQRAKSIIHFMEMRLKG